MSEQLFCTCYRFDKSPHDPACPNNAAALVEIVKKLESERDRLATENEELRSRCDILAATVGRAARCLGELDLRAFVNSMKTPAAATKECSCTVRDNPRWRRPSIKPGDTK